jgi:hypothetical protein
LDGIASIEDLVMRLEEDLFAIGFTTEDRGVVVSEVMQIDDADPFVILLRIVEHTFVIEVVTVLPGLWIRELRYRLSSYEALKERLRAVVGKLAFP